MSHTPNELTEEFPEQAALIHKLRAENTHFAKLCGKHHTLNREIHRGETDIEPMDDMHLEELKKARLALLDEIAGHLK
ncbi:MAG: YdcH family protein [Rhodospirillales bacterium]